MQSRLAIAVSFFCICQLSIAHEDIVTSTKMTETDRKLYSFCESAILFDRGFTRSSFSASTDRWIANKMAADEKFRESLAESRLTLANPRVAAPGTNPTDSLTAFFGPRNDHTNLQESLTEADRQRLPGVYLRLEGLIALCRPQFRELFNQDETQGQIRKLACKIYSERVAPIHQRIYLAQNDDEFPAYHAALRRASAELDWHIVQILSNDERERLLSALSMSKTLDKVAIRPFE